MSNHLYSAIIHWEQPVTNFAKGQFSREHTWTFDGGAVISASPAPSVVPAPWSNPAFVDPEEAFVASLSSCHMLVFLYVASRQGFQVVSYHDEATGLMGKNERGIPWVSQVTLHPAVTYTGDKRPSAEEEARLHHVAHEQCYIANSVKTEVTVSPAAPAA
jgi:organic hydroperoxide reductase OsmC/OhrA